jgi:hypothetical protein
MSTSTAPIYCFVVEDAQGDPFELEILPTDERAKQHFQSIWQRLAMALEGVQKIEKIDLPGWASWQPWKWCVDKRSAYLPRQQFVAWCGPNQIGILNLWPDFDSVHDSGKMTLYIEHVGASPGNLDTSLWNRLYRGIGTALMAYAVKESEDQGFDGRLTLHASDDEALAFYRNLDKKVGGNLFFPERTGVVGPTPHGVNGDAGRTFLETTPTGAKILLGVYRV